MSSTYGVEDRRLLETTAAQLYAEIAENGSMDPDDARLSKCSQSQAALDLLVDIGLLAPDDTSGALLAMDPATVQSRVVVPLGQEGVHLLSESSRWADAFAELGHSYRMSLFSSHQNATEIRGFDNINNFIQVTLADCQEELLTAQPHRRRPAPDLAVAVERDVKALTRGVAMRTLYQHSARHSLPTREYVNAISAHGAEVRTLDEFFNRLIVVDRQVAIIPSAESHSVAVAVYEKSLIAYLVDIFQRAWARAQPFTTSGVQTDRNIAAEVRAMTIRMLVEGHSDPASAKRLGVSTRTYAGYIAALKEEFGVQTRFQLGHAMGHLENAHPEPEPGPDDY